MKKVLGLLLILAVIAILVLPACSAKTVTVTATPPAGAGTTVTVTTTATSTVSATAKPPASSTGTFDLTFAWTHDVVGPKTFELFRPGGEFQRMMYEKSNGRIRIKVVEKMFPATEQIPAVVQGKADLADVELPYFGGTYPWTSWGEIPGLLNTEPTSAPYEEIAVYRDPRMRELWINEHRKIGVELLFMAQGGSGNLLATKKVITKADDLKGLKSRVYGSLAAAGMKALGAATVTMPLAEVETAVMTGVVDGILSGPLYLNRSGMAKVVPNMVYLPLAPIWTDECIINPKTWASLPPDLQQVFREVSTLSEYMISATDSTEILMAVQGIGLQGGKVTSLDPAEFAKALALVAPLRQSWLTAAGPTGTQILAIADDVLPKFRAFKPF